MAPRHEERQEGGVSNGGFADEVRRGQIIGKLVSSSASLPADLMRRIPADASGQASSASIWRDRTPAPRRQPGKWRLTSSPSRGICATPLHLSTLRCIEVILYRRPFAREIV